MILDFNLAEKSFFVYIFFIKKCRCRNCRQQHLMFLNISKRSFVGRNGNYRFYFLPVNHHGDSGCSVAYLQRIVYRSVFVIHTFRQCFRRTGRGFRRSGIRRKTHDNIFLLIGFKVIFISVFRNSQPVITSQLKPRLIEIGRQPFAVTPSSIETTSIDASSSEQETNDTENINKAAKIKDKFFITC